jgi:uncharacterized protein YcbX
MPDETPIQLRGLHLYPVKSCHRIELERATVGERGLQGDREWMVTDSTGRFLTQRTHPALARIRPSYTDTALLLHHPGRAPLTLPRTPDEHWPRRRVRVWDDEVDAAIASTEACNWVSEAVGTEALLVRAGRFTERQPSGPWRGDRHAPVNFPDAYPLLVCNQASLEDLNGRLPEPLPMSRFRPNLVIDGLPPYAEDEVAELRFGALRLALVKACTRCSTTTIDQDSGEPSGNPLAVLRTYRFDRALRGVTFGQNALMADGVGTTLEVGDRGIAMHRRPA